MIRSAIRKGTISLQLTPVLMGPAYKNRGVQPLLGGVALYLLRDHGNPDISEVRVALDPTRLLLIKEQLRPHNPANASFPSCP